MTKDEILNSQIKEDKLEFPALYLDESIYDHKVANRANLDFLFVSEWSNFKD